jgi:hypothetical protein
VSCFLSFKQQEKDMKTLNTEQSEADRIETFSTLAEARAQFGENYGDFVFALTRAQVEALLQGQVIAFDINSKEYAGFLVLREKLNE